MKRLASAVALGAALYGCHEASSASPAPVDAGDETGLRVPELGSVPPLPGFPDDPVTAAEMTLGTDLFFDPRLSGSGHTACDACHISNTNWQDGLALSTPDRSYPSDSPTLPRNTLSFLNLVYAPVFRWDGSQTDLVAGMAYPLAEPNMNVEQLASGSAVVDIPSAQAALYAKLTTALPGYVPFFQDAFGQDIASLAPADVWTLTGRALRAFVTQAVSRDSAFDRWNAGDDTAMSAQAVEGLAVFRGKGQCISCHVGPFFTDFGFHNVSTSPPGPDGTRADVGRYAVTGDPADEGAFLTPTLRGAYDTGPYFHDGSREGLLAVLSLFASNEVLADPSRDPVFSSPLPLTEDDANNLSAFIEALRGAPGPSVTPPSTFP